MMIQSSLQQKLGNYFIILLQKRNMKNHYSSSKGHPGVNPNHPGFKTRPPHDVFPQDIQCVWEEGSKKGAIYIGNLEAAESIETLRKLNIGSVLTACKNVHIRHPKQHVPYSLYIPGQDHENYDLSVHFDTAINFIHQSRKFTNILVHCMAGVSRSVTLVLAYMMKHIGLPFQEAYRAVQKKRNKINPNPGFIRQLKRFQQKQPALDRSRLRHSTDHYETPIKSKYDSYYKSRPVSFKDQQNETSLNYKYTDFQRYRPLTTLQNSQTRIYNPQYEQSFYKTGLNSTLKTNFQSIPRNNSDIRLKEGYRQIDAPYQRQTSIFNLSKDLDDRIAKIKKKYYQASNQNKTYDQIDYKRWQCKQDSRMSNNYVADNLARSRASRQSLRNSIYTPFNATKNISYQYS